MFFLFKKYNIDISVIYDQTRTVIEDDKCPRNCALTQHQKKIWSYYSRTFNGNICNYENSAQGFVWVCVECYTFHVVPLN